MSPIERDPGNRALRKIVYLLDFVLVLGSFFLAFVLQDALQGTLPFLKAPPSPRLYRITVALFTIPLWMALIPVFKLHLIFERFFSPFAIAAALIKHHFAGFVALTVMLYVTQIDFNRSLIGLFMACTFTAMLSIRLLLGWRRRLDWKYGYLRPNIILVGEPSPLMAAYVADAKQENMAPNILGRVGENGEAVSNHVPYLGSEGTLTALLHEHHADQVLFFPPYHTPERAGEALIACETVGVPASLVIDLRHPGRAVPRVARFGGQPFITFDNHPPRPELLAFKHGFDAVASAAGLLLLGPLLIVTALLILITMGRPILFIQERAGRYGRIFRMLKFRTMKKGADREKAALAAANEMDGPVFKIADDPRVTRLGRFLRKSSIDELPQLVNVLTGTMSLVGPRPLPIAEQQDIYGRHRRRLSMKPGITGLWQVSGRSNIDFEQWMALDLQYIDNWSPWLDLKILFKTVYVVLIHKGAK